MEAVQKTVNNMLEKLNLTGGGQGPAPPKEPSEQELKQLRQKYEKAGQDQVFTFYDSLDAAGKGTLYEQLSDFDPEYINQIFQRATNPPKQEGEDAAPKLEPLPDNATCSVMDSAKDDLTKWYESGLDLMADNAVGVVLMAGGQGTRLGSSAPKGCYDIGLPSKKSLFQMQGERIWKAQQLAAKKHNKEEVVIPWYVMTSGPTRKPTADFFEQHKYFGLKKENVIIFEQGVLPCISNDGKILMETKSKVSMIKITKWLI